MKQGSTFILKTALIIIGAIVLAICIFLLPGFGIEFAIEFPSAAHLSHFIVAIAYATTIPFFIALYQAFKLLIAIDKNTAFSEASIRALKNIKYCGIAISLLYIMTLPAFYYVADAEDAPGVIIMGMFIVFAPFVIATFAGVLQKLLKSAIDMKEENELTV
ncbi:MAG TPA: DUF2975 domain-containing protein [Candidatus Paceibacterota bacterium]